jgi:hypothetical protein
LVFARALFSLGFFSPSLSRLPFLLVFVFSFRSFFSSFSPDMRDLAALVVVVFALVACGACGTPARAAGAPLAGFSLLALSAQQGSAPTTPASSVWLFASAATLEKEPYAIIPVPNAALLNGSAAALAIGPSVSSSAPTSAVVLGPQALAALTSSRGDSQFERTLASGDTTLSDVAYVDGDGSTSGRMIALGVKVGSGVFFPNEVRFFTSTNGGGEWKSLNTSTHTLYTNGSLTFVPGSATGYACSSLPPIWRVINDCFVVKLSVRMGTAQQRLWLTRCTIVRCVCVCVWCAGVGGLIFRTTDGGQTWKQVDSATRVYNRVAVFNTSVAVVTGRALLGGGAIMYVSINGGDKWSAVTPPAMTSSSTQIAGMALLSSTTWVLAAADGSLWRTADGSTWTKLITTAPADTAWADIEVSRLSGSAVVVAVGSSLGMGVIASSTDQGLTWDIALQPDVAFLKVVAGVLMFPSPSPSPSPSASRSPSPTRSPSSTPSLTPTPSPSTSPSSSPTPSSSPSVSITPSRSPAPSSSPSASVTPSGSPTPTASATRSASPSLSPTPSRSASPSISATATPSRTSSPSVSVTPTPSPSPKKDADYDPKSLIVGLCVGIAGFIVLLVLLLLLGLSVWRCWKRMKERRAIVALSSEDERHLLMLEL